MRQTRTDEWRREATRNDGDQVKVLLDPKIFNYVIMFLYGANVVRWAFAGKMADVCYWLSALAITATVTFMYKH